MESRALLLLVPVLLAAGCASPDDAVGAASADAPAGGDGAFVPWRSEGSYFVEPSQGPGLSTTEVPFLVNGTGRAIRATVTMGERYGPVELPRSTAYLEAGIVDASGRTLAEARRMPLGEPTVTLTVEDAPVGEARLVLGVGGGSDGKANGDHVTYALDVA